MWGICEEFEVRTDFCGSFVFKSKRNAKAIPQQIPCFLKIAELMNYFCLRLSTFWHHQTTIIPRCLMIFLVRKVFDDLPGAKGVWWSSWCERTTEEKEARRVRGYNRYPKTYAVGKTADWSFTYNVCEQRDITLVVSSSMKMSAMIYL